MSDFGHLEAYLERLGHQDSSFGAAVAVVRDAKIVYAIATGHYGNEPIGLDTPLPVASLSKPVFAYGVLKLYERGVLDLDTPLTHYLPTAYLPDEPYLPFMTARHALSHTTGFPNWRGESGLQAAFHPGSAFHYSTEGLLYLQTVIEHLTGGPLADSLHRGIFKPFGMAHSMLVPEDLSAWQPHLPGGLRAYGGLSLHTTAPDYGRFLIEMLGTHGADEFRLSSRTLAQMLMPQIRVGDHERLSWGLGWGLQHGDREDSFWHFGVRGGRTYNVALGSRAEQTGVVILISQSAGSSVCEGIARVVLGDSESLPAFRWLLPPERWRADGRMLSDTGGGRRSPPCG